MTEQELTDKLDRYRKTWNELIDFRNKLELITPNTSAINNAIEVIYDAMAEIESELYKLQREKY